MYAINETTRVSRVIACTRDEGRERENIDDDDDDSVRKFDRVRVCVKRSINSRSSSLSKLQDQRAIERVQKDFSRN